MNNIKIISKFTLNIANSWYLLLLIPAVLLALFPYFRLNKKYRKNRNRVTSMILHIIILFLLVLALSGLTIKVENVTLRNQVLIVTDISDSTVEINDMVNAKVIEILENANEDYEVGIISFANEHHYTIPLSNKHLESITKLKESDININKSGSNIESALIFASNEFKDSSNGRIILISDGLETDGNALAAAQAIAIKGIRIDVIYIPAKQNHYEVQISEVIIPDFVEPGKEINIDVILDSRTNIDIYIKIFINGIPINGDRGTNHYLNGTNETISFTHTFDKSGLNEIKVLLESDLDIIEENNVYYSFVYLDGSSKKMLLVEGSPNASSKLIPLIENEYEITIIPKEMLAANPEIINSYESIVLMNIANSDLPRGFDLRLKEYVEIQGGSLMTIGGDNAYHQEDMQGSVFESLLPVYSNTQAKSIAVMLVIDTSGSMWKEQFGDTLSLAKEGAIQSVLSLADNDYVGVVTFDATPRIIQEPIRVTQKDMVIDKINAIEGREGTIYSTGLQTAKNLLDNFEGNESFNKHVIFLSDGDARDDNYQAVLDTFGDISVSTISISGEQDFNPEKLRDMVRVVQGRGQYHHIVDSSELPNIMVEETLSIASEHSNTGVFEPYIYTRISAVAEFTSLPNFTGYYGTRLKQGATLVLSKDSDPIYAKWDYGIGTVASLMVDLNGIWSKEFLENKIGIKLIQNLIRDLMPENKINASDTIVTFKDLNFQREVKIITLIDLDEKIVLDVTNPNNQRTSLELLQQTTTTFTSVFDSSLPGIYQVIVTKYDNNNNIISTYETYHAVSYSAEYNNFYDEIKVFAKMNDLVSLGNGTLIFETKNVFSKEIQTVSIVKDPTVLLLIIALILFLLDIITRKFKFKLPNEWFKKKEDFKN